MLQQLLLQFRTFSRENWWIYILLCIALVTVFYTWKGSLYEVVFIFFLNLSGALCNMLMMSSYKDKKFVEGSIFIVSANTLYTFLSLYAWIYNGDMQYIFWQASFTLTGFKALFHYTFHKSLDFINFKTILLLNIWVMYVLISHIWLTGAAIIQSLWIASITLGIVLMNDIKRYFWILFGNTMTTFWSFLLLFQDFARGEILGITVAYFILGLSISVYNYKILPEYIKRLKHT